jgi:putative ABC transport system permease protein
LIGDTRRLLFVLLGAVALTLIVACANIGSLLLARSIVRQKELAVRAALGAGRMRLLRQIFTESLVLALTGGILGVILASLLVRALVIWNSADLFGPIARLATFSQDTRVLVFTLLASLFCAACFGLLAAVKPGRTPLSGLITQSGHRSRLQRHSVRQALVIGEVAVAVVLLVGTGLFVRSFVNLLNVDPGYRSEHLLTSRVSLPVLRYQDRARRVQVQRDLLERIAQLPGVERVGGISALPLTGAGLAAWLSSSGPVSVGPGATTPSVPVAQVSSDYFPAMGIALRAGRLFDERDDGDAAPVIILSESVARQLFPDQDPVGRTVWMSAFVRGRGVTVTGVVADVRHEGLDRDVRPQVYIPYQQFPPVGFVLAVRTASAPQNITADVRAAVLAVDPELPLYDVVTMEQRLAESVAPRQFMLLLVGSLGLLALVLALVGIFGVVSYLVTQRTREIGIRMALGACHREVLALVLRQGLAAVAGGLVIGVAGATVVTRFLSSMLFELSPLDPVTFAAVAIAFAGIATCAVLIPARRAARVNPLVALRYE